MIKHLRNTSTIIGILGLSLLSMSPAKAFGLPMYEPSAELKEVINKGLGEIESESKAKPLSLGATPVKVTKCTSTNQG
jgi:hypothetical protein